MSRPTSDTITNVVDWDIPVDANTVKTFGTPFPPAEYADYASLPAPGSYDRCFAVLLDEDLPVFSTGGVWVRMGTQAGFQADSTAATVALLKADLNSLLALLIASNLMAAS